MRGGRKEYQTIADAMVESGMVAAGYTLLSTVCTGWQARDPVTHELRENLTNWPGGMKDFAAYLHGKGMQLSVCECRMSPPSPPAELLLLTRSILRADTDAGTHNCCGEPGSLGMEDVDMKTFASWNVDAVGIDYCGGPGDVHGAYQKFATAIDNSGRDMQLGMWNLGEGAAYQWAPAMSRNMTAATASLPARRGSWVPHMRLTPDIGNIWAKSQPPTMSVLSTMDFIQNIDDLWDHGMGNQSGTFPNYGQMGEFQLGLCVSPSVLRRARCQPNAVRAEPCCSRWGSGRPPNDRRPRPVAGGTAEPLQSLGNVCVVDACHQRCSEARRGG